MDNIDYINNYFKNFTANICLNICENVDIHNNIFKDSLQTSPDVGGNGYGIVNQGSSYVRIYDNEFIDVQRHSVYLSVYDFEEGATNEVYGRNIDIYNNTFRLTHRDGNYNATGFEQQVKIMSTQKVRVYNNVFENCVGAVLITEKGTASPNPRLIESCPKHINVFDNTLLNVKNETRTDKGFEEFKL